MKIGDLAKKTGCKVVTIRYYEKEGLLPEPERGGGNYRHYNAEAMERLELILHCRRHDMKLDDIRKLLLFRDQPRQDCTWVSELLDRHIGNVDKQIKELEHLKYHLQQLRGRCAGGQSGETCGIMQGLTHEKYCQGCKRENEKLSEILDGAQHFNAPCDEQGNRIKKKGTGLSGQAG